jgi:hypothetical protein
MREPREDPKIVNCDYTKVKKTHQTQIKSFFHSNKLYPTHSIILSFVCLSNLYNLKKELIILVLVLKKIQTVFFFITKIENQTMFSSSVSRAIRAKRRAVDRSHEAAIAHLTVCVAHRDQCELDLKNFRLEHPNERVINANPVLRSRHLLLITAKNEAWEAYFKAHKAANPKTIEDILWIMAKAGHTQLVAPLMNLSKVTRTCIHLQPIMMNVKLGRRGFTQLHFCADKGLTTSVKRLLSIRNINVNVKNDANGETPLHYAAWNGHVEIVRLLLQNGAEVNVRSNGGSTPLHWAAIFGHVDILHLLVENDADLEAQNNTGMRALHRAADYGHLPFIQELISRYHVDINARVNDGRTALWMARTRNHPNPEIITFLQSNGGI